ncbi:cell wall anchor protein [Paraburkholderia sp. RL18-103-BIB-C]|uniref:cell wall anchor protein n=1 Tax=Paraburkholderia sp. RL18-103-BIB-C TaxID=3031637 RepID=UPI0038B72201
MGGTVAIGTALVGAPVTVTDSTGKTAAATSGSNGTYTLSITGLTAPFVITATDQSGASSTLYSVVASANTSGGAPVIANVTPLTTAVAALLTTSGNPLTLTQSGGLSVVTPSTVNSAVSTLDTAIAPILSANGLSASSFDPIGGAFTPNQTGADGVIDSVAVAPSASGTGLQLTSLANPNTSIQLSQSTTVSTALQAPSQPANYLASLLTALGQCTSGTSSACSTAIDASYLNDGFSTMQKRHPGLFASGSTLTGVKTMAFLPAGSLPNITGQAALVYFLYASSNGTANTATDIVQQLPNGNWDIVGNQEQYNLYIGSFQGRVQFTDSADANNGRFESGLNILIPGDVTVNGTSTSVGSALVQGPGLPASGVYMLGGGSGFGPYLMFPVNAITAPPAYQSATVPMWPNVGISTQYKWNWASLSGGTSSSAPSTPDYTSAPANVSSIQQYGVYTVTLYDYSGNQIGTPQSVVNVAPNVNAATGATVAWQTLGSDVVANLLTPGGAGASATGSKATIDWTAPAAGLAYPNAWVSINSQGAEQFSNGVETYQAQPYDAMNWSAPTVTGTTYSTTVSNYVDVLTGTASSSAEQAVQVQLGWQAGGEFYSNIWQYNN